MRRTVAALVAGVALLVVSPAGAQDVEQPSLPGYEFCGWKNFSKPGWTLTDPEGGVYLAAFARGLTCTTARRNTLRDTSGRRPLLGYRCVTLERGHEFLDVRCTKRGTKRAFRYQTGA